MKRVIGHDHTNDLYPTIIQYLKAKKLNINVLIDEK